MENGTKRVYRKRKITDVDYESKSFDCFNAADAKFKESKFGLNTNDGNKPHGEEPDMELLRKIDFMSFLAYLFGYIFFNIFYWAKMMAPREMFALLQILVY